MTALVIGGILAAGVAFLAVGAYGSALMHRRGWWMVKVKR